MPYRIAGIDVHKKMLAVAVADVEVEGEWQFDRREFGTSPNQLRVLAAWLAEYDAEEVVMESTAQYWRPVWQALERHRQPTRRIPEELEGRHPGCCISPRPSQTGEPGGGRRVFRMPNDW